MPRPHQRQQILTPIDVLNRVRSGEWVVPEVEVSERRRQSLLQLLLRGLPVGSIVVGQLFPRRTYEVLVGAELIETMTEALADPEGDMRWTIGAAAFYESLGVQPIADDWHAADRFPLAALLDTMPFLRHAERVDADVLETAHKAARAIQVCPISTVVVDGCNGPTRREIARTLGVG